MHSNPSVSRSFRFVLALLAALALPAGVLAQLPTIPSVDPGTIHGSITESHPAVGVVQLSLDDAVRRGLAHNLQLVLTRQNQRAAAGERLEAVNFLMPNIQWQAQRSRQQFNLQAEGFRANVFASFPPNLLPPSAIKDFHPLVTANVVEADASLKQTLFDLNSYELYRAAKQEIRAIDFSYQSARGAVIQQVADQYLLALANAASVDNAQGLLKADAEVLRQARLRHQAGTAAKLDELRAQVQYQQQEQAVIAQQNAFEKSKIALNREIGLPADQPVQLTDATPYAALDVMPLNEALQTAYRNRQEYLRLQAKLRSARIQARAARYERLPTLKFDGNYGVTGTVGGIYHGTFLAQGTLSVPLFREAKFRGDRDVADAAASSALSQLASFRTEIESQIRDSMLDVAATRQLVSVARSNVDLAQNTLDDATVRFQNGVDDDLPVVQAQATLAAAQAQLVDSLYRFNVAKMALARSVGIIDREYRNYLGPAVPAPASDSRGDLAAAASPAQ
jgi:outer membrane protein TolC